MSLRERITTSLLERRNKILKGEVNCIPLPFNRFRSEWCGVEQGRFYLVSGASKSSKTQLTNYIFVYNTILFAYYNKGVISPKIFYYNLEETKENITLRFISFLLNKIYGIHISPTELNSTNADAPVPEEILQKINEGEIKNILDFYEQVMDFRPSSNPTGVYKDVLSYAKCNGKEVRKKYSYKDEWGQLKEGETFDYYIPNNPREYVFIIIDHVSLLSPEKICPTLREAINKLTEYLVMFRNRYNYIPVVVQQQNMESISLEAFKNDRIAPVLSGLADSKDTGKACDVMIGILNPFSFQLREKFGYDITRFKGNFRSMEIVLNRAGQSNGVCPLLFDGAINRFDELCLPNNKVELEKVYKYLDKIRNKQTVNTTISMFVYGIIKRVKDLLE